MNAANAMTRDPVTVREDTPLAEVIRLMLDRHISGVPVVARDGTLVGIVTEGDLLRRAETGTERQRPRWFAFLLGPGRLAEDYVRTHARKAGEVMTRSVVAVPPDTPLADVVTLMEERRIKRVPVVVADCCVGIVSRADLIRALGRTLDSQPDLSSDDAIRDHVLQEIRNSGWAAATNIAVTVSEGVVHLDGVIFDERERSALRVAAESAPGGKDVRDHLTWVEPNSGAAVPAEDEAQA